MISKSPLDESRQNTTGIRAADEQAASAFAVLQDLNAALAKSRGAGFGFLSYLLEMAQIEAQNIASNTGGQTVNDNTGTNRTGSSSL